VLTPRNFSAFPPVAAGVVALTRGVGALGFASQYLGAWIGENFLHRMRTRVFAHLHTLSVGFFDRRRLGDVLSRLTGDVAAIESVVLSGVIGILANLMKIAVFTVVLFYLDARLALASLIAIPVFWIIARSFARRIKIASREVRARVGSITVVAEESLGNATLIQAYGRQNAEVQRFATQSLGSVRAELAATRIGAMFTPLVDLIQVLGVLTILGVGIWELTAGHITLGGLLAFLVFLAQLYQPVQGLGSLSTSLFGAAAAAERIIELLDECPTVPTPPHPTALPSRPCGHLTLEHVTFTYPHSSTPALTDVTFSVPPGHTTAVVGASGAGKTTLLKLLLRFYDPTHGTITLDGIDLRNLDPHALPTTSLSSSKKPSSSMAPSPKTSWPDGRAPPTTNSSPPPAPPTPTTSSLPSPRVTRPASANAADSSPAANANASPSHAPSSATPLSCSSTNPPPASTPTAPTASSPRCADS
jgi:ATP-binding cassette subfamily B protein